MTEQENTAGSNTGQPAPALSKPDIDWSDPSIPPGDAPPMPRWPLMVSAVAYGLWLCFLVAMAVLRFRTTAF